MDKLSYVLGMSLGQSLQASGVDSLEFDDFLSGVKVIFSRKNLAAGREFLKKNAEEPGVTVTASGLQYKVIRDGEGNPPGPHGWVKCNYEGRLINGQVFDSSYMRGVPAKFGLDQVIPGWTEGLQLMKVGSKYEFYIPADLAYGEVGVPGAIPGNSTLIFTVELLGVL